MKKIAIVGGGNFGANAAFYLAENNLGHVVLIDHKEGLARGKALDLMEAAPVRGFSVNVTGAEEPAAMAGAAVVVFAAGASRKAGGTRQELLAENQAVLDQVLAAVKQHAPEAVVIVQREPVAALTAAAVKAGLKPGQVLGLTGMTESARFRFFMARVLGISPMDTTGLVIGGPGEHAVALTQYANISGVPLTEIASAGQITQIIDLTRKADEEILGLLRLMPAYYTPAAVLGELIQAIVWDQKRYLPVTVAPGGAYGLTEGAVALPTLIGAGGCEKIVELELSDEQRTALATAAKAGV